MKKDNEKMPSLNQLIKKDESSVKPPIDVKDALNKFILDVHDKEFKNKR